MRGLNILLAGIACWPEYGSEPGITWNWGWHLAARNRVWVITHGFCRPAIERYLSAHPRPNLRFVWVGPLGWWDPFKNPAKPFAVRIHYVMWRRAAAAAARRVIATEPIDLLHHVSFSTLSAPPLLWQTGKPFVWGPVGGGQVSPSSFLPSLGWAAVPELLRSLRVGLMPWTPSLRRTVNRTDLLVAANRESAALLRRASAREVLLLPDIGIQQELLSPRPPERPTETGMTILWAGRLERWKGLALCLDVAKAVRPRNVRFLIAGAGPDRGWAEQYADRRGLGDRVTFLGALPWAELQQRFGTADLFLFTSLRDTLGAVNFEAMAKGCPVLCLDHAGVGTHLPTDAAIKVPVTTPGQAAREMAQQIEALCDDRTRLGTMSEAAYRFALTQDWDQRARLMEAFYRQVLARRGSEPAEMSSPSSH